MSKKTIIVNLFAGAGAGKTTCAWEIASELKKRGIETEYVSEYAKELVWDNNMEISKCKVELRKFDKLKSYLGIESVNEIIKAAYQSKINQKEHTQEIIK